MGCRHRRSFNIIDLSLAPTPAIGDSVARIIEEMGLSALHLDTCAVALLNDAVKRAASWLQRSRWVERCIYPRFEDEGMIEAAQLGAITIDKLEAMTCVCSVGLDMIAVPGDTPASTISPLSLTSRR